MPAKAALKTAAFWIVFFGVALTALGMGFSNNQAGIAKEFLANTDLAESAAIIGASMISAAALGNLLSKLSFGFLADRIKLSTCFVIHQLVWLLAFVLWLVGGSVAAVLIAGGFCLDSATRPHVWVGPCRYASCSATPTTRRSGRTWRLPLPSSAGSRHPPLPGFMTARVPIMAPSSSASWSWSSLPPLPFWRVRSLESTNGRRRTSPRASTKKPLHLWNNLSLRLYGMGWSPARRRGHPASDDIRCNANTPRYSCSRKQGRLLSCGGRVLRYIVANEGNDCRERRKRAWLWRKGGCYYGRGI